MLVRQPAQGLLPHFPANCSLFGAPSPARCWSEPWTQQGCCWINSGSCSHPPPVSCRTINPWRKS